MRFVALATIWAAGTVVLFMYVAQKKLEDLRYSSHFDIETTGELFLPITVGVQVATLVVFGGILAYTIHLLLKRLSQALFAIKRNITRIADGDLSSEVVIRRTDEFQGLAMDLDEMRGSLREKFLCIKEQQQELSAASTELSSSIITGTPSLSSALSLQSAVERMKEEVRIFRR
jgi:methyl-accepting chemotaxis protein